MAARVVICRSDKCKKEMVFLINAETGHALPIDFSSLTMDEKHGLTKGINVLYNDQHHISHYKTCADPNRFSKKKIGPHRKKFGNNGNKL